MRATRAGNLSKRPHLLNYTVLTLTPQQHRLHQLHTVDGGFFVMGQVAASLFDMQPNALVAQLRSGKHAKSVCSAPDVLAVVVDLGLPTESSAQRTGVMLLPPATVEALLQDMRRLDLLHAFRMASLKLASQEAARLMVAADYEAALPVTLEAVRLGETLFKPQPALQVFPLYLLAAQANLGLRRTAACEQCLALCSVLALREPELTTHSMRSQLSRLYGQLYALQGKTREALAAFAEDIFHASEEHGPEGAPTSLGYYNLAKVLQASGNTAGARSCSDMVVSIWCACLQRCVLGCLEDGAPLPPNAPTQLPVGHMQLAEVVEMLADIGSQRAQQQLGSAPVECAAVQLVSAMALLELGKMQRAQTELQGVRTVLAAAAKQEEPGNAAAALGSAQRLLQRIEAHISRRLCKT